MRILVWTCRVIVAAVIACFVATLFYLTHTVTIAEGAKAALNWVTVAGAGVVGLAWPLMRRYWQALLLLIGLGVFRGLFGTHPAMSSLHTPLLTPFQSDFLWIPMGVVFVALVGAIVGRAIVSDRNMQAMRRAASTVTTGQDVATDTEAALREVPASAEPQAVAADVKSALMDSALEASTPAGETPPTPPESPAAEKTTKKK